MSTKKIEARYSAFHSKMQNKEEVTEREVKNI
jgi:hypothetical protein